MTRAEAAELLGVAESVAAAEIRKRYEALHTEFQIRLTNAPTPALKKTYQQKLQEIAAASEVLDPGFANRTGGGDLPSAEPTFDSGPSPRRQPQPPRPARQTTGGARAAGPEEAGLPRSTLIAGVCAVVLAAALSFAVLQIFNRSAQVKTLEAERARLTAAQALLQAQVDAEQRLLHQDRLRVRNLSQHAVKISAVAFVYRDPKGTMRVAHSGNFDYPTWEIRPESVVQLDAAMGRGRMWDGGVVYYSFLVEYPGVEPFLKTGIWVEDIDRLDKVVTLDLD